MNRHLLTQTARPEPDEVCDQAGALCRDAAGAVLLVTSLDTGRWVLPKGWPMPGRTLAETALQEAWEEAGVRGRIQPEPMGNYVYPKLRKGGALVTCRVWVFPVVAVELADTWPEAARRRRAWLAPDAAAQAVVEPGLRDLLAGLRD